MKSFCKKLIVPLHARTGLALAELLLAAAILVFVLAALLLLFINCIFLNQNNRNLTLACNDIQAKMEEIKNTGFDSLDTLNGTIFDLDGFPSGYGKARIEISDESTNLKRARIAACYISSRRLFGDNIDNCQSSPLELVTLIAK